MATTLDIQPIILAAGKGTRMRTALPKVLVGFQGKPLIQYLLDSVKKVDFKHKPVIVVGHKYDLVQSFLGPDFIYAFQEGQMGTGHAVLSAKSKVESKNVLVLYGDTPFIKSQSIKQLIELYQTSNSTFSMFTSNVPNFDHQFSSFLGFGRIIRDSQTRISKIQEFPDASEAERQITEVNPGIYLFSTKWLWSALEQVPKNKRCEYYLTDLVEIAIRQGVEITTASIDPLEVFGINTPAELKKAEDILISV